MKLEQLRKEIDSIDLDIIKSFEKRMAAVAKISKYKRENNLSTLDAGREAELLKRISKASSAGMQKYNTELFNHILKLSKQYQDNLGQSYGLVGERLSHSFSVLIHNLLANYTYMLYEISPQNLEGFLKNTPFLGLNVTIPYKQAVIPYCADISDVAKEIGSVNTLLRMSDGSLYGDNTDIFGFLYLLKRMNLSLYNKKVMILGSGGSCKTVICAAKRHKAREIVVISRNGENNYENIKRHFDSQIIVNTTPVGMFPANGTSSVNLNGFNFCEGVIDLIYNPDKTALLLDAQRLKIRNSNGLPMLVAQAKASCELFGGKPVNDSVIEDIIEEIQRKTLNITLVGMPGSGKSTVGRILAQKLDRDFIDTDSTIKNLTGRTADDIIKKDGEECFRDIEEKVARDIGKYSSKVISTGGGIVTRNENFDSLRQNSTVIFLQRDIEKLSTVARPLSKDFTTLQKLYAARLPLYKEISDYTIFNNDTPENIADKILEMLNYK